ncbi:hypothetical protein EX895_000397 [Sporisorium graminicola]|uniref:HTH APSES-type domain-containing protein n=1 Tax=Sporisorium graminicola TaxID=280036 RepID=A0A4V6EUE6_9BASI|nr:hypothetical protein EX895_000397 [Sporisorium graminicola]TKY90399.1 hypothetical protein EX895_000397 [Sporisorium graminicola]
MPIDQSFSSTFNADAGIAKKRGLPYARNELDAAPLHLNHTSPASNPAGGSFYISGPRPARLFPTAMHEFRKGKYATTGGDRGFMTVFEYDVRGHTMMIDVDNSCVRFTSITQALGKNKVNFGRLVRTCPALAPHITKLKGGYLSIQGTWLPYDLAKELSRRIAWEIRDHLVPLFGYDFPSTCLRPDSEGFGQLAIGMSQKRARKRHNNGGPHQTSCYGPSMPICVVEGQTLERTQSHQYQQPPAATFHYSKGLDERSHWYGSQALGSQAAPGSVDSMMWPTASTFSTGGAGPQATGLGSAGSLHAPYPSNIAGIDANSGSPILSSPPSSNASSMSYAQSTAANYNLMVPPTVPSHAFETGINDTATSTSSNLFDLHHVVPLSKDETAEDRRGYGGFSNQSYATYGNTNDQLSAWSESNPTSAYVSSSPTPPPPAPHGASASKFDSWHPSSA